MREHRNSNGSQGAAQVPQDFPQTKAKVKFQSLNFTIAICITLAETISL